MVGIELRGMITYNHHLSPNTHKKEERFLIEGSPFLLLPIFIIPVIPAAGATAATAAGDLLIKDLTAIDAGGHYVLAAGAATCTHELHTVVDSHYLNLRLLI